MSVAVSEVGPQQGHFWLGVWRVADPRITLASVASMLVGGAAAAHDGPLAWGWLALTALGVFCVEAAKNASGEVVDFDSGTDLAVAEADRSPFSGGKRVLVDGLMSRRQVIATALVFYALAGVVGLAIVLLREPAVLGLAAAGVALAFFYHAPPLRLSYRGLGEVAVALCYGPLIAAGTYLVQRHAVSFEVAALGVPLGLLVAAFLVVNEFPDATADAGAGKRTWVVRLGRRRATTLFAGLVASTFAGLAALPLVGLPAGVVLGFAGLPHAFAAARQLRAHPEETREIVPAQAWTLLAFVLLALGVAVGLLLSAPP